MLQRVLEKPLEKKAGRNYGPPGTKRLIYFIDDMNMPEVRVSRQVAGRLEAMRMKIARKTRKETCICTLLQVDMYFTVQPHTLIRQHLDYSHWYDRTKLMLKDIHNTQYVSCMNPTAGSFTINPRLQVSTQIPPRAHTSEYSCGKYITQEFIECCSQVKVYSICKQLVTTFSCV